MGQEQLEILSATIDAWNRGDVPAIVAHVTPDSVYVIAEENPSARVLRGPDEIAAYFTDWRETLQELRYEVGELVDAGDAVVAIGMATGRAGEAGPRLSAELAFVFRFDGMFVVRAEEYLDAQRALEAAGLA